jgi:hypothetical protein
MLALLLRDASREGARGGEGEVRYSREVERLEVAKKRDLENS